MEGKIARIQVILKPFATLAEGDQAMNDLFTRFYSGTSHPLDKTKFLGWESNLSQENLSIRILNLMEEIKPCWDTPEEARDEVKDQIDKWYEAFYGECSGCQRENQHCVCP